MTEGAPPEQAPGVPNPPQPAAPPLAEAPKASRAGRWPAWLTRGRLIVVVCAVLVLSTGAAAAVLWPAGDSKKNDKASDPVDEEAVCSANCGAGSSNSPTPGASIGVDVSVSPSLPPTSAPINTPGNDPPTAPSNPTPANAATKIPFAPTLTWSASADPEDDPIKYDVVVDGTTPCADVAATTCALTALLPGTSHTWRVTAKDDQGGSTQGPAWSFTVRKMAEGPQPGNATTGVSTSATLRWVDPDATAATYTVYFGTNSNPTQAVCPNTTTSQCNPGTLQPGTRYYWRVVIRDSGLDVPGLTWNFTTGNGQDGGDDGNGNDGGSPCTLVCFT